MKFIFEQIPTGGDRNFGYLIADRDARVAALVDPSYRPDLLLDRAQAQGLNVAYILNTHGHHDHTNGNAAVLAATTAKVAASAAGDIVPDIALQDGQVLHVGSIAIEVLHTPGHCPDHVVFHLPEYGVAITGDHLFVGKIGGTVTEEATQQQFRSLRRICQHLPDHTTVWPGHDVGCRPSSTMAWEKATNPFLLTPDLDAFLKLKISWAAYKTQHGLK